jgi:hypothetical protein
MCPFLFFLKKIVRIRSDPNNTVVGPTPLAPRLNAFSANTIHQCPVFKWLRNLLFGRESVESQY